MMRSLSAGIITSLLLSVVPGAFSQGPSDKLPRVVLLGDSIRLGYTAHVVKQLEGTAVVISPKANGGDSSRLLGNIEAWAIKEQPAVVHFNCGIHDIKKAKATGKHQVSPEEYEANLRQIVARLRKETKATILFGLTTPILDDRAAKGRQKADYDLLEASASQYNAIAKRVMKELDVPVNDLRAALGETDQWPKYVGGDGIHFKPEGSARLGSAVAAFVRNHLPASGAVPGK